MVNIGVVVGAEVLKIVLSEVIRKQWLGPKSAEKGTSPEMIVI